MPQKAKINGYLQTDEPLKGGEMGPDRRACFCILLSKLDWKICSENLKDAPSLPVRWPGVGR